MEVEDIGIRPGKETLSRGGGEKRRFRRRSSFPEINHRQALFRDAVDEGKQELARSLLRTCAILGAVLLVPALFLAIKDGDATYAIAMSAAYASILVLSFLPVLPSFPARASIVAVLFIAGACLAARPSSLFAGAAWLCAASSIASILLSFGWGLAVIAAQVVAMAAIGAARRAAGGLPAGEALGFALSTITAATACTLACFAETQLSKGMRRSMSARDKLAKELFDRQDALLREAAGRHDAERRADFLESHDSLTRLRNRENFELELAKAIEVAAGRGRILGVMAIGIDRFKRVAEIHGPGAGDALLIEAANRLMRSFRDDDLVAREGGDVFLVLLSDMKVPEDAKAVIEKSRRAFDRSFSVNGSEIGLSASFGLALFPNDGIRPDALIRASGVALHLAKEDGPGSYRLYDASLHERLLAKGLIEQQMRGALRSGAFLPWYQPKVDSLGRIVGAEALARWLLPEGDFRQPADFIQEAERSGSICDLGRMVLAKACASAAAWARNGLEPIPVSVNLSPFQFRSDDIVRDVRSILGATSLPASRLDLEITESGIMDEGADAIEKLAELKALGCSITIDDFGTGYSSFAALRDFPVDCVKLPQSFVEPLPSDPRASAIASAVIDLAHVLRFSVVAEGVETRDQFAWLDAARCDQYQGFLFAKPMPERAFESALAKGLDEAIEC